MKIGVSSVILPRRMEKGYMWGKHPDHSMKGPRNKTSEESHQVKHWLTDHQDLLALPKFSFSMIQSLKDPLSHQKAVAVRIDLRGENILNSKAEYMDIGQTARRWRKPSR